MDRIKSLSLAKCFSRLQHEEFRAFLEYLNDCRANNYKTLAAGVDLVQIHRAQGEITVIEKLLDSISTSQDLITKLNTNGRP